MDIFELINKNRIDHGYIHKNYMEYKRFCNKKFQECKKEKNGLGFVYKVESNFSKFQIFQSIVYLRKCIRVLNKVNSEFKSLYLKYIDCHIDDKKGILAIDSLIELRHELANYYAFLDDIYCLNDNRHNFDSYKVKYMWNDVPLLFETQKLLDEFLSGTFLLEDHRFNTQIALKISRLEQAKRYFEKGMEDKDMNIIEIFKKSKSLNTASKELMQFLEDNFIDSSYVRNMNISIQSIYEFVTSLLEYRNGIIFKPIKDFVTPAMFSEHKEAFDRLMSMKMIKEGKLRPILFSEVEKSLECDTSVRKMPFLPVFYDLAYDYIAYPQETSDLLSAFKGFSFFNKK